MEKKKLKLSISGSTNKTINSIEQAKSQSKNTVLIEKKPKRFLGKSHTSRPISTNDKFKNKSSFVEKSSNYSRTSNYVRPSQNSSSDFEKRKLAEQRATKRIKGEVSLKDANFPTSMSLTIILFILAILVCLIVFPWETLLVGNAVYLLTLPIFVFIRRSTLKKKK